MTAQREDCGLLCYPPNGSLIAVGDALDAHISSVEVLRSGNCNQWQRLASIPFAGKSPCVEYLRDRIFVFLGASTFALTSGFFLMSSPPGTDAIEQWISLSTIGFLDVVPTLLAACNDQLFSIGRWQAGKLELLIRAFSADMATNIFDFSLQEDRGCRNSAMRKATIMRQAKIHNDNNICILK